MLGNRTQHQQMGEETAMQLQDRRIRRTQHLLAEALIALTLEKGYEAVTIRDITKHADIGYATFFRHYRDKDELLQDVLDVVLAELIALLRSPISADNQHATGIILFRYLQEHEEVVRVLLKSQALRQSLLQAATASTCAEHEAHPDSVIPFEIAAHHIVASTIALAEWWLDHNMPYSTEQMGLIYAQLIACPTAALAFLPKGE